MKTFFKFCCLPAGLILVAMQGCQPQKPASSDQPTAPAQGGAAGSGNCSGANQAWADFTETLKGYQALRAKVNAQPHTGPISGTPTPDEKKMFATVASVRSQMKQYLDQKLSVLDSISPARWIANIQG